MRHGKPDRNEFTVVLRFQGEQREGFRLVRERGNFYVILPGGRTSLQWHVSYHASGEWHFKVGRKGEEQNCFPLITRESRWQPRAPANTVSKDVSPTSRSCGREEDASGTSRLS